MAATVFPLYLMLATSTKSQFEFATNFWGIGWPVEWSNFKTAWDAIYMYIFNSLKITFITVLGITVLSVMTGYAFAKLEFKGKNFLYMVLLAFQMVPSALLLIPQFVNVYKLGLYNTHAGVILPSLGGGSIVAVVLPRSFFEAISDAIFESARIEGAGEICIITKIVLPLSKPIVGTNALLSFFGVFNAFTWPYIILSDDKLKTITIGLNKLTGQFGVNYGVQMAAYTIICVPLIILIACTMRVYVAGITVGAVKS